MKQIQKRGSTKNWKYTATVRLNGHSVSQTFTEKTQAREWANRVEIAIKDELARGKPFNKYDFIPKKKEKEKPLSQQIAEQQILNAKPNVEWTLKRAIEEYKNTELEKLKGFKQALNRLKAWEKHAFAQLKLNELSPLILSNYIKEQEKRGLSASTIRNDIFRISAIYELAKKPIFKGGWGLELSNPVNDISLPTPSAGRQRRLRKGEEQKFFEEIKKGMYAEELFPFCILALETGMRKSEILGIKNKEIHITESGWNITKLDTKNGHSRVVYLSQKAEAVLKPLFDKVKHTSPDSKIFQKLTSDIISNWIAKAKKDANLQDFRLHDLRHEAVSRLADKGLSVGAIASQSGHKSMQTLLRYVNAKEQDIRDKLEKGK
ncbi:site-specific integrase [Acetobacter thailandicus]|uniref:site-specific integrase n=1 Tax=Acetobacter thailandicus TaxID=1502842 RepID=UPI001BA5C580|nr:site-specific integrase [Acetobacter thailandicus]MBS0980826.1 site-specific integrase [Acetobacter thailandicus]